MSIQYQAGFWLRNVCDSDFSAIRQECNIDPDTVLGLQELSSLLRDIYSDYRVFEVSTAESGQTKIGIMSDDLENYHHLTDTVDCLYQMVAVGSLDQKGNTSYLEIDKAEFKKAFKGSATFPFQILENYGFSFRYCKKGKETFAYKSCDAFLLFSDAGLPAAMKYISSRLPDMNAKEDYIGKKNLLFSMADYESILLKKSTRQTDTSPLKQGIINTAGGKGELWSDMAQRLMNDLKLTSRVYIEPYVFPHWTVKFIYEKKTVITFYISPDTVSVSFPLSYDMAKNVIANREKMPDIVRKSIEQFGCMGCKKCLSKTGLEIFESVPLCGRKASNSLGESPRGIRGDIVSQEDATSIFHMVKGIMD